MEENTKDGLIKYLSPVGAWALAFGCSVGWGAFVMPGTTFLPIAGPVGTALGILVGGLFMLLIGVNYHYLMNRYPDSGGSYAFSKNELGYDQGFISAWFLILVYMAIVWANATAIPLIFRKLFPGLLEFGPHYVIAGFDVYLGESIFSAFVVLIAGLICLLGGRVASVIQSVLAFILIGGITVCMVMIFLNKGVTYENIRPAFADSERKLGQVFRIVALAPWAYVGFESISHSTEEYKFSPKKSMRIFAVAIFTAVCAYSFLAVIAATSLPDGIENWRDYLSRLGELSGIDGLPTFHAVVSHLGDAGFVILGIAVGAGILTGLIGNITAASRLIYCMARDNITPSFLGRISKKHVPDKAILLLTFFSMLVPFLGRTAISWIVDVNTIGATIAYVYTSYAAYKLARKKKSMGVMITGIIGIVVSLLSGLYFLVPNLWTVEALSPASYMILIAWSVLGFLAFYYVLHRDESKRFGNSSVVWVVLLFLVFFVTMLWFRESTHDASKQMIDELSNYDSEQLVDHGIILNDIERLDTENYLNEKMEEFNRILLERSILQMAIIMIALFVMFNIYSSMQKKEREMELQKIKAEQNSKAKSLFLSNMSHDIRTPMNAIIGYSEMTKNVPDLPEEARINLEKIDNSSKHLLSVINDVLDLGRIESGRMELDIQMADLNEIFDDIHSLFVNQMESKGIDYVVDIKGVGHRYVMCDANRLNRVLLNLISNALKFTSKGGSVTVRLKELERGAMGETGRLIKEKNTPIDSDGEYGSFELRVKDTGMGMSPEFAKTVFEAYTRENTATKIQGTGLGMAITKSIIDLMGGGIRVETEKGVGTEFIIDLDLLLVDEEEYKKSHVSEDEIESRDYSKVKVLLVEDQELNKEIATYILSEFGFNIDYAENGRVAYEKVKNSKTGIYDIVLMDIQMPEMNGYDATKAIRALEDEKLSSIPIIAMTANAFSEDIKKAEEAGMNGHIAKPLEIDKMMETINSVLFG
ncbi:MAG: amino acid permease [Lachnospiraceae bacterium]|nr:amino acid permease [Lachnospiraceae bacterium]